MHVGVNDYAAVLLDGEEDRLGQMLVERSDLTVIKAAYYYYIIASTPDKCCRQSMDQSIIFIEKQTKHC